MYRLTVYLALFCFLSACRKNVYTDPDISKIRNYLSHHLSTDDYNRVNWRSVLKVEDEGFYRIRFSGPDETRQFIILKEDSSSSIAGGRIIDLDITHDQGRADGSITRYSLSRNFIDRDVIKNGDIGSAEPIARAKEEKTSGIETNGSNSTMPLLLMMHYTEGIHRPFMLVEYVNIQRAYNNIPGSSGSYTYTRTEQKNDYGGGSSSTPPETIVINDNDRSSDPPLDVAAMIKCLNSIPDQGAQCTITLFADVPVDNNPELYVNWNQAYPGHSFLQITKSNQGKTATYNIGFYPKVGFKSLLTNAPILGKFVDDAHHEADAWIKMGINFEQLFLVLQFIQKFSLLKKYDIDDFNCTDFALNAFNRARGDNPLVIPRYNIPGGMTVNGTSTPQGLFLELQRMRKAGIEKPRITIPTKGNFYVGGTYPCK